MRYPVPSRACRGVWLLLCVLATAAGTGSARAQSVAPEALSGTLIRIWADPAPGSGAPTQTLRVLSADGRASQPVAIPDAVADAHGGVDHLVGRAVTVTVVAPATLAVPGQPPPLPTAEAVSLAAPLAASAAPLTADGRRRWVAIPCRFGGNPSEPFAPSLLAAVIGDSDPGLGPYFSEVSLGTYRIQGEAVGWQQLPRPHGAYVRDTNGDG